MKRTWVTAGIVVMGFVVAGAPGCRSDEDALASGSAATARGNETAGQSTPESPAKKGKRVTGGFPPIRRADLASSVVVPGGQRFILGGEQPSSFYCDVMNSGETTVMVFAERNGGSTVVAKLGPGDSASHRFQPTEAAVVSNLSPIDNGKVKIRVWGDTNLGMSYESAME